MSCWFKNCESIIKTIEISVDDVSPDMSSLDDLPNLIVDVYDKQLDTEEVVYVTLSPTPGYGFIGVEKANDLVEERVKDWIERNGYTLAREEYFHDSLGQAIRKIKPRDVLVSNYTKLDYNALVLLKHNKPTSISLSRDNGLKVEISEYNPTTPGYSTPNGTMTISGIEHYFRLTHPTICRFNFNLSDEDLSKEIISWLESKYHFLHGIIDITSIRRP